MNPTIKKICEASRQAATDRQSQLTKPIDSLGQLETIAIALSAMQRTITPSINAPWISIFAADHGVTEMGVSAYPAVVTQEMVKNFSSGGAAITVLAKHLKAQFEVVDVGVINDVNTLSALPLPHLVSARVAPGTKNFTQQPAMTTTECQQAMQAGQDAVSRALDAGADIFIGGEMGIGNTTAATAIIAHLANEPVANIIGMGTGIDDTQKARKTTIIETAIKRHQPHIVTPLDLLQRLGGFEIAALVGAYLEAGKQGLPMVVDGVIASASAWIATLLAPDVKHWMLFGHESVEPAQRCIFNALNVTPILNLGMRLGEGSGAAMAIPTIQLACLLQSNMATFAEAEVSTA